MENNKGAERVMRSLLQKAVRRGNIETTRKILLYLVKNNDFDWVRKRLAAITFEECWPYAYFVSYEKEPAKIISHYLNLACSVKNKDAAGLGSFAYAFSEGNSSFNGIIGKEDFSHIKMVAGGLENPESFWEWAKINSGSDPRKSTLVSNARESSKKVSWPWDKAFVVAGAYLAVTGEVPKVKFRKQETEVPPWVGIDKHTPLGKAVIRKVAAEKGIDEEKAMLVSFYFAGAVLNNHASSGWWDKEVLWKLTSYNLTPEKGREIWNTMQPRISRLLENEAENIREKLDSINPDDELNNRQQMGLF